jgi:tyrosyl-tRNA synthetase
LDGVNKMSKSLGNYIGITEAPEVMYGKVMQISDELMWRYYELLTDRSMEDITAMRAEEKPMEFKMALARQIVSDFHSGEDACRAEAEFTRVVRRHEAPADMPSQALPDGLRTEKGVRLDKLLAKVGLADSVSDATRKIKSGAVEINGRRVHELVVADGVGEWVIQAGKKWCKVVL